jgi:hypothetical protein
LQFDSVPFGRKQNPITKKLFLSLIAIGCLQVVISSFAQVPGIINYQGRVTVAGTNFDGTGLFKFSLVNNTGATTYWSNGNSAVSLTVTKGLYAVLLGDTTIANMSTAIPASVFTNSDVRLRVWFNDGVTGPQQLSPDQRIAAAGYALSAANAFTWQNVTGTSQQAAPNTGYIVNNSAQVTITLPASPNVGDIVRVSGVGAGGWKIAQNSGQSVLVGNVAALNVGTTWTPHGPSNGWDSVASSADGTKLIAGVAGGQIYISADSGTTWTPHGPSANWGGVASSADGTKLAATAGQIYISVDSGTTWTPYGPSAVWLPVASSGDGTKLVAGVLGGQIYTSADSGMTWTPHGPSTNWLAVASSADGTKLVASVLNGPIYTSGDSGVTWTPHGSSVNWNRNGAASSADGIKLIVGSNGGQIYTSTDSGTTWSPHGPSANWHSVASSADGTKLLAADDGGQIYTSTDSGMTWVPHGPTKYWYASACSADGTKLVVVDAGTGQIYTSESVLSYAGQTTTPGNAGYLIGGQGAAIELQYVGNSQFLPISYAGTIFGY